MGTVGYGVAPPPLDSSEPLSPEEAAAQGTVNWHRSAPWLTLADGDAVGPLSTEEVAALEATFGTAKTVDVSATARVRVTIVVWYPVLLVVALVLLTARLLARRLHVRRGDLVSSAVPLND